MPRYSANAGGEVVMDAERFDTTIRMFGVTGRRRVLAAGLGATLAGLLGRSAIPDHPAVAAAACAKVGKRCRHAVQCCSGVCTGKHGKKKCRGHDAGTCRRDQDACIDPDPAVDKCNNDVACICYPTTAGTSFCADVASGACADCARDADCLALGFPAGTACLAVGVGRCSGFCPNGTACNPPCPTPPPPA